MTSLTGNRYQLKWSASDDSSQFGLANGGIAGSEILVSYDGVRYTQVALVPPGQNEYTFFDEAALAPPTFLIRSIDQAGNVEFTFAGLQVPELTPMINLGAVPRAIVAPQQSIALAQPDASSTNNRLLQQLQAGVRSSTSSLLPSRFIEVYEPIAAERFAAGLAIAVLPLVR